MLFSHCCFCIVEPLGRRVGFFVCDDFHDIVILEFGIKRGDLVVDVGALSMVADVGVYCIGEIDWT